MTHHNIVNIYLPTALFN